MGLIVVGSSSLEQSWQESRALLLKAGSTVGRATGGRAAGARREGTLLLEGNVRGGSLGQGRWDDVLSMGRSGYKQTEDRDGITAGKESGAHI